MRPDAGSGKGVGTAGTAACDPAGQRVAPARMPRLAVAFLVALSALLW
ncbi:MAG: hypothetical protein JWM98_1129, partial [Thermoleophilia bacterium]|nr:hypothetical protein [Thermoleophilia bacterium]